MQTVRQDQARSRSVSQSRGRSRQPLGRQNSDGLKDSAPPDVNPWGVARPGTPGTPTGLTSQAMSRASSWGSNARGLSRQSSFASRPGQGAMAHAQAMSRQSSGHGTPPTGIGRLSRASSFTSHPAQPVQHAQHAQPAPISVDYLAHKLAGLTTPSTPVTPSPRRLAHPPPSSFGGLQSLQVTTGHGVHDSKPLDTIVRVSLVLSS